MAKRKDLLLTEATTMRMMGLAGLKPLASSFLKEQEKHGGDYGDYALGNQEEEEMDEGKICECGGTMEEGVCESCGARAMDESYGEMEELEEGEDGYMDELEEGEEDESLEEGKDKEECEKCGESPCECEEEEEGGKKEEEMNESIKASLKRLKRLLEQAEAPAEEPPAPEAAPAAEPPPAMEGGGNDEMEAKIKEFVKKLGQLVQETLGVEVTVEESGEEEAEGGEPEGGAPEGGAPPPPGGGAPPPPGGGAPPAPLAEAINRLVNKVARRVKARLMEAKKDPKARMMKEKQMAAKKKKMEMEAKKKKMEMMRKKAAKKK